MVEGGKRYSAGDGNLFAMWGDAMITGPADLQVGDVFGNYVYVANVEGDSHVVKLTTDAENDSAAEMVLSSSEIWAFFMGLYGEEPWYVRRLWFDDHVLLLPAPGMGEADAP